MEICILLKKFKLDLQFDLHRINRIKFCGHILILFFLRLLNFFVHVNLEGKTTYNYILLYNYVIIIILI